VHVAFATRDDFRYREIRKITNSAGFTGAIAIKQMSRPLSTSFCEKSARMH